MSRECPYCGHEGEQREMAGRHNESQSIFRFECQVCGAIWGNRYILDFFRKDIYQEGKSDNDEE